MMDEVDGMDKVDGVDNGRAWAHGGMGAGEDRAVEH